MLSHKFIYDAFVGRYVSDKDHTIWICAKEIRYNQFMIVYSLGFAVDVANCDSEIHSRQIFSSDKDCLKIISNYLKDKGHIFIPQHLNIYS